MAGSGKPTFTLAQVLFGVGAIFGIAGIIPALLDAENNAAVIVGVMIVVSVLYGVVKYHKEILSRFGIEIEKGDED